MLQNLAEQSRNTTWLAAQVIARLLDGRVTRDQQRRNWFAPIAIADDVDNPDCRFPDYGMGFQDDKFWADYLGTDPADWDTIGVSVLPHVGLRGYSGLWCFRRNRRAVVSAPRPLRGFLDSLK